MTKEEFIQQYKASRRAGDRRAWVLLPIMLVSIIAVILFAPHIGQLAQSGFFDWAASFNGYWILGFFGGCLLIVVFGMCWVRPPHGVACPACGERLWGTSAQLALAIGNCGYCGERIVIDPLWLNKNFQTI